jgi:hypothetical protein
MVAEYGRWINAIDENRHAAQRVEHADLLLRQKTTEAEAEKTSNEGQILEIGKYANLDR